MSWKDAVGRYNTTLTLNQREQEVVTRLARLLDVKTETNVYRRAMRHFLDAMLPELAKDGLFEDRYAAEFRNARPNIQAICDRHLSGAKLRDLAEEYGVSYGYMTLLVSRHLSSLGLKRKEILGNKRRERATAFLAANIGSVRQRQIVEAIATSTTYEEAAQKLGVSRQRIEQVLRIVLMWSVGNEQGKREHDAAVVEVSA